MAYETILVETRGRVELLTLNRPKALNAINRQLTEKLISAAESFDYDLVVCFGGCAQGLSLSARRDLDRTGQSGLVLGHHPRLRGGRLYIPMVKGFL
jgi:enoyl-CoA hydratase/carnithine racemase